MAIYNISSRQLHAISSIVSKATKLKKHHKGLIFFNLSGSFRSSVTPSNLILKAHYFQKFNLRFGIATFEKLVTKTLDLYEII